MNTNDHYILIIQTENKPGVLNKIASLCRRRRYNVESITAGATNISNITHITLVLSGLRQDRILQIINQINKIIEVISVEHVQSKEVVDKEMVLMVVANDKVVRKINQQAEPLHQINIKILNKNNNHPTLEITGEGMEIEHILSKLNLKKDIIKMARSGLVALKI